MVQTKAMVRLSDVTFSTRQNQDHGPFIIPVEESVGERHKWRAIFPHDSSREEVALCPVRSLFGRLVPRALSLAYEYSWPCSSFDRPN
jgi:hypothetical protein